MDVVLGLGCNLGDRLNTLKKALELITQDSILKDLTASSIYENPALLLPNSPPEWNIPFLNLCIKGKTTLSAYELLLAIKNVEKKLGRQERSKWAPREIDIDILIYENQVIEDEKLIIPHKELLNRDFVLIPLAEIWPDWIYPLEGEYLGKTIKTIKEEKF